MGHDHVDNIFSKGKSQKMRQKASSSWFLLLCLYVCTLVIQCQLTAIKPGKFAPSFALQTLKGRIVYLGQHRTTTRARHPVIFHAFTRHSAFVEAMWTDNVSLGKFLELSPRNTHYVFMSLTDKANSDALWMRKRLYSAIEKYYRRYVTS